MNMKTLPHLILIVLLAFTHSLLARPVERVLTQAERISLPKLGISITVPANTQIIGPADQGEAVNYVFPWFQLPSGKIELAIDPCQPVGSLKERVEANRQGISKSVIQIIHADEPIEAGGLTLIRADCEGIRGFKIVRYYFLTPNGKLAFMHLSGAKDLNSFQFIIIKAIQKS